MNTVYHQILKKRIIQNHQKQLRTLFWQYPPSLLNFSSTDFLNLTKHPFVKEKAIDYALHWGNGSYSLRHLADYEKKLIETEKNLASLLSMPTAILLESNPFLFSYIIQSLIVPKTLILKSHSFSIPIKGPVHTQSFNPKDFDHLRNLLESVEGKQYNNILILVDSLSTHSKEKQTLKTIGELSKEFKATLVVDDSLSLGVLGAYGMGLSSRVYGCDVILGSFGKTFSSYASYIACSKELKTFLGFQNPIIHNFSPLPPFFLGLIDASLSLIPSMTLERTKLLNHSNKFQLHLKKQRWKIQNTQTHIITFFFDSLFEANKVKNHLTDHQCIPFIPSAPLQIEFRLNLSHSDQSLTQLLTILKSYRPLSKHQTL